MKLILLDFSFFSILQPNVFLLSVSSKVQGRVRSKNDNGEIEKDSALNINNNTSAQIDYSVGNQTSSSEQPKIKIMESNNFQHFLAEQNHLKMIQYQLQYFALLQSKFLHNLATQGETIKKQQDEIDIISNEEPQDQIHHQQRRSRTNFHQLQLDQLEAAFQSCHYPDVHMREDIASRLGLSEAKVSVRKI